MATIGLDKLYYAPITEDENGYKTCGTPKQLAKAISAELAEDTSYHHYAVDVAKHYEMEE